MKSKDRFDKFIDFLSGIIWLVFFTLLVWVAKS